MSDYQTIRYRRDGDVGTLTLARPGKRNAQNPLMWEELARLGDVIDAEEALRIGLANQVVPAADLDTAAAGLAARLAAQPPLAVRGARRAIDAAWYRSPEESLNVALEEQLRCLRSEDFKEAGLALAEGRNPAMAGPLAADQLSCYRSRPG